jgi:aubergine
MVNKRVNTRIIADNGGKLANPMPGTVLDHSITQPDVYDFYMVNTNCRQGVPAPTHISVLFNNIPEAKPEHIQLMCYKLCYLYYNFSGPIKIPAPIRYADRLANMIGERGAITQHPAFGNINGLFFI